MPGSSPAGRTVSHGAATTVAPARCSSVASNASLGVSAGFDRQVARTIRTGAAGAPSAGGREGAQHRLLDVAPAPGLARLERLDDRVVDCPEMLRGVPARRVVAATHVAATHAEPQVDPAASRGEALFAPRRARCRGRRRHMGTGRRHLRLRCGLISNATGVPPDRTRPEPVSARLPGRPFNAAQLGVPAGSAPSRAWRVDVFCGHR